MDKEGTHLAGITSLMNKQHINQYADIDRIEKSILNKNAPPEQKKEDYNSEVDKLAKELGLDFGGGLKKVILDDVSVTSKKSVCTHCSKCSNCSKRTTHQHTNTNMNTFSFNTPQIMEAPFNNVREKIEVEDTNEYPIPDTTDEHSKKLRVMDAFNDIRKENKTGFSMNVERTRDTKSNKIEQICNIVSALDEEGVDIKSFNIPSTDATMQEIDSVLNLVNMKMNRTRYSSLFEEIVIGGAEFMESKLNGTRSIPPFNWKPDYTGYSNTVSVKLHRMRYETSKLVGNSMEKLNIGSTTRILMELLPSLVLYPKSNTNNKRRDLADGSGAAGSFGNIRGRVENEWNTLNSV
jgi:hypothetical protein